MQATAWDEGRAREIIAALAARDGAMLPILHALQDEFGHVAPAAAPLIAATSRLHHYRGDQPPLSGDLCDLYPALADGAPVLLKVARQPSNHDLLRVEAATLARLARELDGQPLRAHFPTLIEHFLLRADDGSQRHVNVLRQEVGYVTLAAVQRAFPGGLPLADAAWMFNRILAALGVIHGLGLVHGALTPCLLYTYDAVDDLPCVDLGGRRIIKKKN